MTPFPEHEHTWKPGPEMLRYVCYCGATGYKDPYRPERGVIEHKKRRKDLLRTVPTTHVGGSSRKGKRGPG